MRAAVAALWIAAAGVALAQEAPVAPSTAVSANAGDPTLDPDVALLGGPSDPDPSTASGHAQLQQTAIFVPPAAPVASAEPSALTLRTMPRARALQMAKHWTLRAADPIAPQLHFAVERGEAPPPALTPAVAETPRKAR